MDASTRLFYPQTLSSSLHISSHFSSHTCFFSSSARSIIIYHIISSVKSNCIALTHSSICYRVLPSLLSTLQLTPPSSHPLCFMCTSSDPSLLSLFAVRLSSATLRSSCSARHAPLLSASQLVVVAASLRAAPTARRWMPKRRSEVSYCKQYVIGENGL